MDKYAVDTESEQGEKKASTQNKCPECGLELDKTTPIPRCPAHGTKPFERQE